jgi:hypothetical protein
LALARQSKSHLKSDALVLESAAMVWIGIENLLSTLFLKVISYFVWKTPSGVGGWATYSNQNGLHMNFPPQEGIAECREWLARELGFTSLSASSRLDQGIQTYCRFLQRAHGHRLDGRHDEAFLHFVIALDLLLGAEGRSSDSVAQRAALIVYRQFAVPLEQQIKHVRSLYNVRSKYVHEGRSISAKDLEAVERLCTEILWVVLAVSSRAELEDLEEWLRRIDYLYAAIGVGKMIPDLEILSIGVPPIGHLRRSPLRVLESAFEDDEEIGRRLF